MKFTSEDLMKAMGLSVGDRIKKDNKIFEIYISPLDDIRCGNIHNANNHFNINNLIDQDFEILPRPKRVGDMLCKNVNCKQCPLKGVCAYSVIEEHRTIGTLYDALNELKQDDIEFGVFDQEIHNLLKARLDKEVD